MLPDLPLGYPEKCWSNVTCRSNEVVNEGLQRRRMLASSMARWTVNLTKGMTPWPLFASNQNLTCPKSPSQLAAKFPKCNPRWGRGAEDRGAQWRHGVTFYSLCEKEHHRQKPQKNLAQRNMNKTTKTQTTDNTAEVTGTTGQSQKIPWGKVSRFGRMRLSKEWWVQKQEAGASPGGQSIFFAEKGTRSAPFFK